MLDIQRILAATITMIVLCLASFWASALAQDVFDSSIVGEPPQRADAKVVDTIRKALQNDPEAQSSDDPILDDVLKIIDRQGSILDGSSLDPNSMSDSSAHRESAPHHRTIRKALTAEQLLRAARLLEQIDPLDPSRQNLVKQMRRESVRLLSE